MKRVICSLLVVMLVLCSIPICGNAAEREQEIIRFEDGSYAVVETITSGARASGRTSGSRPYTYYDSTGTAQWKVVLNGSFYIYREQRHLHKRQLFSDNLQF